MKRLLGILATAMCAIAPGAQAADRAFSQRYSVNGHVDVELIANTLETCPDAAGGCAAARAGGNASNNDFTMQYVGNVPGTTLNSSTADLSLDPGSTVRFALLTWSGAHDFLIGAVPAGDLTEDKAASDEVLFDTPDAAAATTVEAAAFDTADGLPEYENYAALADVTDLVIAGGSGTYRVSNVQASKGSSSYAGWSLLVVYENSTAPLRNVTVFDGLEAVNIDGASGADNSFDIAVSGFATPPSGTVQTKLGVVSYDGDRGITAGELFQLHDGSTFQSLSDASSPLGNQFNSSISTLGTAFTAKAPDYVNQLGGVDADVFDASDILPNGATSTQIRLGSSQETIYPHVLAFATVLYSPELAVVKTATDVDGGSLQTGDVVEYALTVTNSGDDSAVTPVVTDQIPPGTTYVPESITVDAAPRTDASDGDGSGFASGAVTAGLPTLAKDASSTARFRVTVTAAPDTLISNVGSVDATAATGGFAVSATSNDVDLTVAAQPAATPTPTPTPTPAATATPTPVATAPPVVVPPAAAVLSDLARLPSTKKCVSRRRFRIRLRERKDDPIVSARVFVNGKRVRTVRGDRLTAPVDLRGLPKGRFKVKLEVTLESGRKVSGTRKYRTCAKKRRGSGKHPV